MRPYKAIGLGACLALGACSIEAPRGYTPVPAVPASAVIVERTCYRTLARVDCHAGQLPGEAFRRVGFYDWAAVDRAAAY